MMCSQSCQAVFGGVGHGSGTCYEGEPGSGGKSQTCTEVSRVQEIVEETEEYL